MNDPTSVLGQSRRGAVAAKRGVMAKATSCCALVLFFLTIGVGGTPGHESEARASLFARFEHELASQLMVDHAWADTSADAERDRYEGTLSTRARNKTH
jgi:hypothetical protein